MHWCYWDASCPNKKLELSNDILNALHSYLNNLHGTYMYTYTMLEDQKHFVCLLRKYKEMVFKTRLRVRIGELIFLKYFLCISIPSLKNIWSIMHYLLQYANWMPAILCPLLTFTKFSIAGFGSNGKIKNQFLSSKRFYAVPV